MGSDAPATLFWGICAEDECEYWANLGRDYDDPDYVEDPVDTWLSPTSEDDENREKGKWCLRAGNYTPRRGTVSGDAYSVYSDNKEELNAIIREKILPLYRKAMDILENMAFSSKGGSLYYWE